MIWTILGVTAIICACIGQVADWLDTGPSSQPSDVVGSSDQQSPPAALEEDHF